MMSEIDIINKVHEYGVLEEPRAHDEVSGDDSLTPSQLRVKGLMERHEAVLAFNARLEAALRDGDTAIIDECIEHSRQNDYMAKHRSYMAELTKDLASQVSN